MDNFTDIPGISLATPIERLELVPRYLRCIAALAGAANDLHLISGDDLGLLIDLITEHMEAALTALRPQLKTEHLGGSRAPASPFFRPAVPETSHARDGHLSVFLERSAHGTQAMEPVTSLATPP